jgi:hypothetical protein
VSWGLKNLLISFHKMPGYWWHIFLNVKETLIFTYFLSLKNFVPLNTLLNGFWYDSSFPNMSSLLKQMLVQILWATMHHAPCLGYTIKEVL